MNIFKKLFDFYIFGNIHVGLAGFCLVLITDLERGFYDFNSSLFVGLCISVSYNFIRFIEIDKDRLSWYKLWLKNNLKTLIFSTIICLLLLAGLLFKISIETASLIVLIPCTFITLFYVIPVVKRRTVEISFRNFPSIKIFSIALCWAGITVYFPLIEAGFPIEFDVFLEFVQRLFFIIIITLPFDIRDMKSDDLKLQTIPQRIGVVKTKQLGVFLLLCCFLLEFLKVVVDTKNVIVFGLILLLSGALLVKTSVNKSRYYTAFWVEGIPIYWLILVILSALIF